jgi:hypothetical protein
VIGGNAIHIPGSGCYTTKEVPAADYKTRLNARPGDLGYVRGQSMNPFRLETETAISGHHFAAELEKDSPVRHVSSGLFRCLFR